MSTVPASDHAKGGAVIDLPPLLPQRSELILRDDSGTVLQSMGEWFSTYQRVTHYFRALDIWQPPPHLLALAIVDRALSKAAGDHRTSPLHLAMDEVHSLLGRQASPSASPAGVDGRLFGSVRWRFSVRFTDGGKTDVLNDAGAVSCLRPVPPPAPGPMVPQPFEASPLSRTVRALTTGFRLRFGAGWRRRHA